MTKPTATATFAASFVTLVFAAAPREHRDTSMVVEIGTEGPRTPWNAGITTKGAMLVRSERGEETTEANDIEVTGNLLVLQKALNDLGAKVSKEDAKRQCQQIDTDAAAVSQILSLIVSGSSSAVPLFMQEPPAIREGIIEITDKVWAILDVTLPSNVKTAPEYKAAKLAVKNINVATNHFVDYANSSKPDDLINGITAIITSVENVVAVPFPDSVKYFKAAKEVAGTAGASLAVIGDNPAEGVKVMYNGLKAATDMIISPEIKNDQTYKFVTKVLDEYLGKLDEQVLKFEEAKASARLCTIRFKDKEESNMNCSQGYEFDGVDKCLPGPDKGGDCSKPCSMGACPWCCGGATTCPRICCSKESTYVSGCAGATGWVFTIPSLWQCVTPGPDSSLVADHGLVDRALHGSLDGNGREATLEKTVTAKKGGKGGKKIDDDIADAAADVVAAAVTTTTTSPHPGVMDAFCLPGWTKELRHGQSKCLNNFCPAHYKPNPKANDDADVDPCMQQCPDEFPASKEGKDKCAKTQGDFSGFTAGAVVKGITMTAVLALQAIGKLNANGPPQPEDLIHVIDATLAFVKHFALPDCPEEA